MITVMARGGLTLELNDPPQAYLDELTAKGFKEVKKEKCNPIMEASVNAFHRVPKKDAE